MVEITNRVDKELGCYELTVAGEVDASSSIHLDEALVDALASKKNIIIDLSSLEYISSAGLGVFMSIIQKVEVEEIGLVLFGLKQKVFDVFEILGLDQLINIKDSKEEALEVIDHA